MGSRAAGKRLRILSLIAASLVMVLASVPALAAQAADVVPTAPAAPPGGEDPAPEPPGSAPGVCDHAAGEFLVGYASEEALRAAPPENVVETFDGILAQHLVFEEIKNIPDPAERLAAEEAKRQELEARPGVSYAEYNCGVGTTQAASAESAADLPAPASCGDCGRYVVDRAKKIIAEGFGDAEGRDAFDAALEAARSADGDDENVAFASEVDDDADSGNNSESSSSDGGSAAADSADEGDNADDSAADDAEAGGSGSGGAGEEADDEESSSADDDESGDEEAEDEKSSSGDAAEAGSEGEEETGSGPAPVSGKNAAATTSEPRETSGTGGKVAALGTGALLLMAGVYVARRTFWS